MRAYLADNRIHLQVGFEHRLTCKALPGARWAPQTQTWHVPATPASADAVWRAFETRGLRLAPEVFEILQQAIAQRAAAENKDASELPDIPGKTPAWLHQRQAFHFAKALHGAMLAMDMGTGKSKTAIALLEEWGAERVLILCPKSVLGVWPNQFSQHAVRHWVVGAPPTKLNVARRANEAAQYLMAGGGVPVALCVNYEAAWRGGMSQLLMDQNWDVVILDESHRVKSPGGKASLFVSRLRERATKRICLTGTPMPHSPIDLYSQFRFLDPGIYGTSANKFKHRYAIMGGYENRQIVGWQNEEELAQKFGSVSFVCKKDDVLDLPPYIHEVRTSELRPKSYAVYKRLESELYADIEEGIVTAGNALTRLLRLQQVTSGYVKTEDDQEVRLGEGMAEKQELLDDLLEDIPTEEPVVVFCRFQHDLDAVREVCERHSRRVGELSGRRHDLTEHATMPGDLDALVVQIQAGGVGIDLTRARYAVYYSLGFSLGDYEQSLARLHRPGQTRHVTYYHLLMKGTVDQKVYRALEQRRNVVEAVVEASRDIGTAVGQ